MIHADLVFMQDNLIPSFVQAKPTCAFLVGTIFIGSLGDRDDVTLRLIHHGINAARAAIAPHADRDRQAAIRPPRDLNHAVGSIEHSFIFPNPITRSVIL